MSNKIHFGEGNLRSVPNGTYRYITWSLPSRITCPYSTVICRKVCFAKKNETFANVRESRERNWECSKKEEFVSMVTSYIDRYLKLKKCKDKLVIVRIHTSGDFYSEEYLDKWIEIANYYKGDNRIQFQSYTKSIIFLKNKDLKNINIHFVYSQMDDTKQEDIEIAKQLDLPIFYATTRENVETHRERGVYCCPKSSDGSCKECYKCNHKLIVVSTH